jgi:MFS family permease
VTATTAADLEAGGRVRGSILDAGHRLATLGAVLVITVVAVDAMAVATIMPTTVRDLHGLRYYAWAFTAFFIADVIGIVDAGARCDRHGPGRSLLGGMGLFAGGLVMAGAAPVMAVFVAGRAVQGLGAGMIVVALYVVMARAYDESLRPKAFAAISAAWVVPALVGPAAAGAVASGPGWRWVFVGMLPLVLVGLALLGPVLRGLPSAAGGAGLRRGGLVVAVLVASGLAAVQYAGQQPGWWSIPLVVLGLALMLPALRRFLPDGTLRLRRGLPATVALRGILAGGFFGAEAYLPLALTRVHGASPATAGLPLTVGALGWAAGSWVQGRASEAVRRRLLPLGFAVVATGIGPLALVASSSHVTMWLALPLWCVAGLGMGLAMPSISVLTLSMSPEREQGANSAALQICDVTCSVVTIGAGGGLVAWAQSGAIGLGAAIAAIDLAMAGIAVLGVLASRRAGHATGVAD